MSHDLSWFWDGFEEIADAPNGVARLRELILSLAVQGRLVPQDAGDEPASVLLGRIADEKARLMKAGQIRKSAPLAPVSEEEAPFELPESWAWVRLGEVRRSLGQKTPDEAFSYVDVSSINKEQGVISEEVAIVQPEDAPSRARKLVAEGTVIYSTVRPNLLNVAIVNRKFTPEPIVSTAFAIIHPLGGVSSRFLYFLLRSPLFVTFVESKMIGVAYPAINDDNLFLGLVPLPPLAEQKRIVAKVDELMALCDELETRQKEKRVGRVAALNAGLHRLGQVRGADEFETRLATLSDHFEELLDAPECVAPLRAAILGLAVQGQLELQNPDDEPASALLERIAREKAELIAQKKIRKSDPLPPIAAETVPFEIPASWEWVRFPELGEFGRGKSKHRPRNDRILYQNGQFPLVQTGDVARSNGSVKTYTNKYNEVGLAQSRLWPEGTLCITIAANIADSGILSFDACFPDSVVGFIPSECLGNVRYFEYFLRTAKAHLQDFAPSTAQKNINLEILGQVLIPLPPLAEQKRIVARVDGLMALCDELEARLKERQEGATRLASGSVAAMSV